jgi:hypothetical protein
MLETQFAVVNHRKLNSFTDLTSGAGGDRHVTPRKVPLSIWAIDPHRAQGVQKLQVLCLCALCIRILQNSPNPSNQDLPEVLDEPP